MKNVKIRLINDMGKCIYLTINYFPKERGQKERIVDNFYLTENARWASPVPPKDARKWMREAKMLAACDGDIIKKAEYICDGKPTTLSALGLKRGNNIHK